MSVFQPTRDEARAFFFEAWRRYRAGEPLQPLEALAADLVAAHPEYHPVIEDPERYRDREWRPEGGETNPFLHLGMHLAVAEQLSIDQPPGIRARHAALAAKLGDAMSAQHVIMECLAEMIWQAQRHGAPLDAQRYLDCVDRQSGLR